MKNYDFNIWDRGAYLTVGLPKAEQYSQWMINPYEILHEGAGYTSGRMCTEFDILLTKQEVAKLKLNKEDDDFFLDADSFKIYFKGKIPKRVKLWIEALPEYEMLTWFLGTCHSCAVDRFVSHDSRINAYMCEDCLDPTD